MSDAGFTIADAIILLVLAVSALLAFARGFVHEVLAVGAWIGAILATIYGLPYARPVAHRLIGSEPVPVLGGLLGNDVVADIGAGLVLFLVTLVVLSMLTRAISSRVKDSQLNALDRSLGFVFGLARGAVLVSLAYIAVEWMVPPAEQPAWLRDARSMPVVEAGAGLLRSLAPAGVADQASTAGDAVEGTRKALETERIWRDMMSPSPGRGPTTTERPDEGYGEQERREMERLLDGGEGR